IIDRLPALFVTLLRRTGFGVDAILFVQWLLAVTVVLLPALVMGAVLPLTLRITSAGNERVARDVGTAYALNTAGAILGSLVAGLVLVPSLGLERGILGAAAVDGLLGLILCAAGSELRPQRRALLALGGAAALTGCLAAIPRWNLAHFGAGLFRVSIARDIVREGKWPVPELLYYRDGIGTTVSVERWDKTIALKNNGKVDASNGDDMP